jgi:hypothetical protein
MDGQSTYWAGISDVSQLTITDRRKLGDGRKEEKVMKRIAIVVGLALCCAMTVWAADPAPKDAPAAMPAMGAPAEMKQVADLVGEFTVAMKYNMGDTTQWMDATGTLTSELVLNGCAIEGDFTATMMGMPMHGKGMTCYNREKKKWQMTFADNMIGSISLYEGDFKDGKLVVQGEDMMQGQKYLTRITYSNITPDKHDWFLEMSMDGGKTFVPGMRAVYTRKK